MKKVVRILLTNGTRTVEIFWLKHMQNGVYFGTPFAPPGTHDTYHRSGKRHTKTLGKYLHMENHVPLAELKERFTLTSVAFLSSILSSPQVPQLPDYKGPQKADALAVLDTRAMPKNRTINLHISLIEPNRTDQSLAALFPHTKQVVLLTSVSPWVEVATTWD